MNKKDIQNRFVQALKNEGIKLTPQRQIVFSEMLKLPEEEHITSDEIYDSLVNNGIAVSRATIYRTLDILVKYNLIRKLVIGDDKARYEMKVGRTHHDHMICIETGRIIEFDNLTIEKLQEDEAEKRGYEVVKHIHQLFVKPINKKSNQ